MSLIAALAGAWWIIGLGITFTLGFAFPLMVFSIMRNIKGVREELDRLNCNIEARTRLGDEVGFRR